MMILYQLDNRFWDKVNKTDSCWEWTAYLSQVGYGQFRIDGKTKYAHRLSYESIHGTIPNKLEIDHLCRNHKCVNPNHLELVTTQENTRRGNAGKKTGKLQRAKTHCLQGHEYNDTNTYIRPDEGRDCRICLRERCRKYQQKLKQIKRQYLKLHSHIKLVK